MSMQSFSSAFFGCGLWLEQTGSLAPYGLDRLVASCPLAGSHLASAWLAEERRAGLWQALPVPVVVPPAFEAGRTALVREGLIAAPSGRVESVV
jgi:hypothetical protein